MPSCHPPKGPSTLTYHVYSTGASVWWEYQNIVSIIHLSGWIGFAQDCAIDCQITVTTTLAISNVQYLLETRLLNISGQITTTCI